jgi:pimeloyl-ACP methyl ester carboxylesterase
VIRRLGPAVLALLLLTVAACGNGNGKRVAGGRGPFIEVNGHDLFYECSGRGRPVVVLESGLDADHSAWQWVQGVVARFTRVCSYDRAGLGRSSGAAAQRGIDDLVDDLHGLLHGAGIAGPYVLAGHSFGGLIDHLYASRYPTEVAGMVLVDSAHPDQAKRYIRTLATPRFARRLIARRLRAYLSHPGANAEGVDAVAAYARARAAGPLDDKPLAVITAGRENNPALGRRLKRALDAVWLGLQRELAQLSTDSIQVIASRSGHDVISPQGQPALVVEAIHEVLQAVRTGSRLGPCRAGIFNVFGGRCVPQR